MNTIERSLGNMISDDCGLKQIETPSLLEDFKRRKVQLEQKLHDINNAIKALEENPEVTNLLLLIAKVKY